MRPDILIINAGDVTGAARGLRDVKTSVLEEMPPVVLRRAAQLLLAGAYSATSSARRFEGIAARIEREERERREGRRA